MLRYKKVRPMFTKIVTTARRWGRDQVAADGCIVNVFAGAVMPVQRVLEVGSAPAGIKVGDYVVINPKRYYVPEYGNSVREDMVETVKHVRRYDVPRIEVDGEECFLIEAADVDCVVEELEGDWDAESDGGSGGVLVAGVGPGLIL